MKGTADEAEKTNKQKAEVSHPKTEIGDWTFSNWPLYMDKKVLKAFDEEFGGKVRYLEDINDNYEFFGKVRQQLENGQPIGRDIVVLTDYMASRWVRNGYAEAIDKKNVPNASNIVDNLATINYDEDAPVHAAVPVGRHRRRLQHQEDRRRAEVRQGPVRPEVQGPRDDAVRAVRLGVHGACWARARTRRRPRSTSCSRAIEKIDEANQGGQFRRFTGNDYTTDLAKGNVWVSLAYSGDVVALQTDNPDLRFSYFDEGNVAFNDNMLMPAKVEHPYAAETMMNYLYEPEVAAKLAAFINYISPVKGAKEILEKSDPEIANNPLIFPPPEIQAKIKAYPNLSPADERAMQEAMAKVTGA